MQGGRHHGPMRPTAATLYDRGRSSMCQFWFDRSLACSHQHLTQTELIRDT